MQNIYTLSAIAKQLAAIKVDVMLHLQMDEPEKAQPLSVQADWLFNPVQDIAPQVEEEMVMLGIIRDLHTEIVEMVFNHRTALMNECIPAAYDGMYENTCLCGNTALDTKYNPHYECVPCFVASLLDK